MANKKASKTRETKTQQKKLTPRKTPAWVWLFSLVPVLSTGLFVLILAGAIPFIEYEMFYFAPGGDMKFHSSAILMLLVAIAGWGACGFLFGYFRAKMLPAVLAANALPIISAVVYTVCLLGAYFGSAAMGDVALVAALGMGLFSYIDTFIYGFFSLGDFGLYLDLIFVIFTFIVGFTIGKSKRLGA